jgi:hypothetical protein
MSLTATSEKRSVATAGERLRKKNGWVLLLRTRFLSSLGPGFGRLDRFAQLLGQFVKQCFGVFLKFCHLANKVAQLFGLRVVQATRV